MTAHRRWAMLAVFALVAGLGALSASPVAAQPDASAAARCSEYHRFGAEPVDVAKTADGQTVLAQVSWGWHDAIGCYLVLDDDAVTTLRAADPPQSLPQGQTDASRQCSEFHKFGAEPVDVAKTVDGQTVLARLSWGRHHIIGCYLILDDAAIATLRDSAQPPPSEPDDQVTQPSTTNEFISISAGKRYTCGVKADNTAVCWGWNSHGQADTPAGHFTAITAGYEHACGIKTDNTAICWGNNGQGQTEAPAGPFTAITAGLRHTCAIRTDNTAVCWGWNHLGQTEAPAGHFTAIEAGLGHTCAIRTDKTAVCWGNRSNDQADTPAGHFTAISANELDTCGIRTDKTVVCWTHGHPLGGRVVRGPLSGGVPSGGSLDHGPYDDGGRRFKPYQAWAPLGYFTAISTTDDHICGIRTDSTLRCWGRYAADESRILGGSIDAPEGHFTAITTGYEHTCGIKTDKTAVCWGINFNGRADAPEGHFTAIEAGLNYTCGIKTDKTAVCWDDSDGFDGRSDAPHGFFTAITAGEEHTCGIKTDKTVQCWGYYGWGQAWAPDGHFNFTAITAGKDHTCGIKTDKTALCWDHYGWGTAAAPGGHSNFTAITASYEHTCGIKTDKTAVCWGDNRDGQTDTPEGHFTAITTGLYHTCGIKTDKTVQCWGLNNRGQADAPASHFTAITAGYAHTCGIKTDKTVQCWGDNSRGQADAPEGHFTAITAGIYHTCGIKADKTVQCWKPPAWPRHVHRVILGVPDADHRAEIVAAEARMAELVNELRQSLGLTPLLYNTDLAIMARRWSQFMRNRDQFVHNPDLLNYVAKSRLPPRWYAMGENISMVPLSTSLMNAVQRSFDGLVASPDHYANMTSPDFNYLGVGIAIEGSSVWVTQNFVQYP